MVKKLVINMECDKDRMGKFKNPTRIPAIVGKNAPQAFKDKFVLRYNTADKKVSGIMGCFASHIKVLNKIVKENLKNVIVLEDDSTDITKLPAGLKNYPNAVYLGGMIVKPKIKDISQPVNKNSFHRGINKIDYKKFRILQTRAYFVPNKQEAKRILDIIHKSPKLKNVDIFFSNNEVIKYFYYPAVSLQTPNLQSRIENKKGSSDPKKFY